MGLSDLFKNSFESQNYSSDSRLNNHYYANSLREVQETITSLLRNNDFSLIHVDDRYHELLFQSKKVEIIVSLIEIGINEVCVSLKVNTQYILPLKKGLKVMGEVYQMLDQRLILKSKGNNYA